MKRKKLLSIFAAGMLTMSVSLPALAINLDELKGKQVRNPQGEELGTIEEVIIGQDKTIEAVVIEQGGFLGIGAEENRIPWTSLKQAENQDYLIYAPGSGSQQTAMQPEQSQSDQQDLQAKSELDQQTQQRDLRPSQDQQRDPQGNIVVQQPGAQIKVDQSQPQVQVQQPDPKVSVSQPPPKVQVDQPPPEVKVIVEQPKPEVSVQQQQPQVDVQQADPKVAVQQAKPEIEIQAQKPEVTVEKSKADVQVSKSGQAEVFIDQQKQAQVDIERQGKPQVEVITQQQGRQQGDRQQGQTAAMFDASKANELEGKKLVGQNGEEFGTIEKAFISQDGNSIRYLIVKGEQDKMHPVPAELVQFEQGRQELTARIDKQTFQRSPSFESNEQPELSQQQWSQDIESHYGASPAWQSGQQSGQQQPGQPQSGIQLQQDDKKQKKQQ